ncbi:hypothetical protein LCGC14_2107280, partial [marine sediment metagenome]
VPAQEHTVVEEKEEAPIEPKQLALFE